MSTLETIKAARDLISDPKRWAQGDYAVDLHGESVGVDSPNASAFCAIGALMRAGDVCGGPAYRELCNRLGFDGGLGLSVFNDSNPHESVLNLFDTTIAELERSQP